MKRLILWGATLALAASPVLAQDRRNDGTGGHANPSAVVAEELAFARLAQEKGQWTAFRATATGDAVMFVPQMAYAQEFLKDKPNPPAAVKWQPHQVWSSCDGSLAVTRGAWQRPDGSTGWFTTVWQKQKKGNYKWVLDQGDTLPMPLDPPDVIFSQTADCPPGYRGKNLKIKDFKGKLPLLDPARRTGQSLDGTLSWEATVKPDGARRFVVTLLSGGKSVTVQDVQVEAPAKP